MTCKLMWSISWRRAIIQPCTSITCAPGLIFLHQVSTVVLALSTLRTAYSRVRGRGDRRCTAQSRAAVPCAAAGSTVVDSRVSFSQRERTERDAANHRHRKLNTCIHTTHSIRLSQLPFSQAFIDGSSSHQDGALARHRTKCPSASSPTHLAAEKVIPHLVQFGGQAVLLAIGILAHRVG